MKKAMKQFLTTILAAAMMLSPLSTAALAVDEGATTKETIYVYLDKESEVENGTKNKDNWYTIGKIEVEIPKANSGDNVYETYKDAVKEALKDIDKHASNQDLDINLDQVDWSVLKGVSDGATDYVSGGWTWHLDGTYKKPVENTETSKPEENNPETKPENNNPETKPEENNPETKPENNNPETKPEDTDNDTADSAGDSVDDSYDYDDDFDSADAEETVTIMDEEVPLADAAQLMEQITREEVAAIFYGMLSDEARAVYFTDVNEYTDVDSDDWSNDAISTLTNAGVLTGYPDGAFLPKESVSRAEFAAIAARFEAMTETVENPFSDTIGHWSESYISFAADKGWITGYSDGSFKPEDDLTRGEVAALISHATNGAVNAEAVLAAVRQAEEG